MVLLQPRLHLKVSQRQILTPGLVQMVSVLALNKLELRDMITAEMVENPVLEELEDTVPLIDDVDRKEEERDRPATEEVAAPAEEKKDPFEEIDFGSFFQDYLDPGYRSSRELEDIERPSFENFLSKPSTLTDHLIWQLGSLPIRPEVRQAAEVIIGNLNEDGYLIASDEELLGVAPPSSPESDAAIADNMAKEAASLGLGVTEEALDQPDAPSDWGLAATEVSDTSVVGTAAAVAPAPEIASAEAPPTELQHAPQPLFQPSFTREDLQEALELVRQLDPPGVACRDLRECLLCQ